MRVEYYGDDAIVSNEKMAFTYQNNKVSELRDLNDTTRVDNLDWANQANYVGDFVVFPHGTYNDLPTLIRDVVFNNYIAPGLLKKKTNLLWGKGPKLYVETFVDGVLKRNYQSDPEIEEWLESWNFEDYLLKQCIDFHVIEGTYTKFHRARGHRLEKPFIAKLEHLPADETRLGTTRQNYFDFRRKASTHAIVNDWGFTSISSLVDYRWYHLFNHKDAFRHSHSVLYSNIPSFCVDVYSLPDIFGSLEWIRRSTAIPLIFKALSKNSINLKFHVESPSAYWDKVEEKLKEKCSSMNKLYDESMLREYRENLFTQITDVLSGSENSGKLWHTTKIYDTDGNNVIEAGWTIKPIDQNTKDFVESQILIKKAADQSVGTGLQIHSALGGNTESGKSDSGSEQLYALKNYLLTGVDIPEMVVCRAVNYAIKANWPDKKLRIGFYHIEPQREEDTSSRDRVTNQV